MPELDWIREDVVSALNRRLPAEHDGLEGVRDAGLLASALARQPSSFAPGIRGASHTGRRSTSR